MFLHLLQVVPLSGSLSTSSCARRLGSSARSRFEVLYPGGCAWGSAVAIAGRTIPQLCSYAHVREGEQGTRVRSGRQHSDPAQPSSCRALRRSPRSFRQLLSHKNHR